MLPVGLEHLVPDKVMNDRFIAYAKEQRLSQADAQRLVDLYLSIAFKIR